MKKNNSLLAQDWFSLAENDLGYAKLGLKHSDKFYSQICIQCHQSIEKYLKGFLVWHGTKPPRIHDLVKLAKLCTEKDNGLSIIIDNCAKITDYYILLRYPVMLPQRTKSNAESSVEIADKIEKLITQKILS